MKRQQGLGIDPPTMRHGEADQLADFSTRIGLPLLPWQRDFLNRLEAASMDKQFREIVYGSAPTPPQPDAE